MKREPGPVSQGACLVIMIPTFFTVAPTLRGNVPLVMYEGEQMSTFPVVTTPPPSRGKHSDSRGPKQARFLSAKRSTNSIVGKQSASELSLELNRRILFDEQQPNAAIVSCKTPCDLQAQSKCGFTKTHFSKQYAEGQRAATNRHLSARHSLSSAEWQHAAVNAFLLRAAVTSTCAYTLLHSSRGARALNVYSVPHYL